jgi:hypothetical protein
MATGTIQAVIHYVESPTGCDNGCWNILRLQTQGFSLLLDGFIEDLENLLIEKIDKKKRQ